MPETTNQNPEQIARDRIDDRLQKAGWVIQSKNEIDLTAGRGVAIREYQTDVGYADYVLFVDMKPVGVIEAKRDFWSSNSCRYKPWIAYLRPTTIDLRRA